MGLDLVAASFLELDNLILSAIIFLSLAFGFIYDVQYNTFCVEIISYNIPHFISKISYCRYFLFR